MDKNTSILSHVIEHIENALKAWQRFGDDFRVFSTNTDYFNSVCMSLLQIGELANHLSADFTSKYNDIPWRTIVDFRNIVVHGYGHLDKEVIWATLREDIPELNQKCRNILSVENVSD